MPMAKVTLWIVIQPLLVELFALGEGGGGLLQGDQILPGAHVCTSSNCRVGNSASN